MSSLRRGLSMIELLVGIVIFSFAMLPLLSFGTSSMKGSYSVAKHMMAGQVAASVMDYLLSLPFEESEKEAKTMGAEKPVLAYPNLAKALSASSLGDNQAKVTEDLQRAFKSFSFRVEYAPGESAERDHVFYLTVIVRYKVEEGMEFKQSLILNSLKFRENI